MIRLFVEKRAYVKEEEIIEFNALCQLLPGPSSTQTLIAIAYKVGGTSLAVLSFLIWVLPSAIFMGLLAIVVTMLEMSDQSVNFLRYIQPMAIGFVAYAAYTLARKLIHSTSEALMLLVAFMVTIFYPSAYVFPTLLIVGALLSSVINKKLEIAESQKLKFNWNKFAYFIGVLLAVALLGSIINRTSYFSLPTRLFENFYRNGSLVFGGGQVLIPLMFTEFVEMKHYISSQEFLSALAIQQIIPGPVFSFTSFLGGISMRSFGIEGQILGSLIAVIAINLPGFLLIIFLLPVWEEFKKMRGIKASLIGINAVAVGFVLAAFFLMTQSVKLDIPSVLVIIISFLALTFTRVSAPILIVVGLLLGIIF